MPLAGRDGLCDGEGAGAACGPNGMRHRRLMSPLLVGANESKMLRNGGDADLFLSLILFLVDDNIPRFISVPKTSCNQLILALETNNILLLLKRYVHNVIEIILLHNSSMIS